MVETTFNRSRGADHASANLGFRLALVFDAMAKNAPLRGERAGYADARSEMLSALETAQRSDYTGPGLQALRNHIAQSGKTLGKIARDESLGTVPLRLHAAELQKSVAALLRPAETTRAPYLDAKLKAIASSDDLERTSTLPSHDAGLPSLLDRFKTSIGLTRPNPAQIEHGLSR